MALLTASLVVYRTGQGVLFPASSAPEAVALLNSMADLAAAGDQVTVAKGQMVRTEARGQAAVCRGEICQLERQDRDQSYDPHEGKVVKLTDGVNDFLSPGMLPGAELDPGIRRPTVGWLASLPSEPGRLLAQLRKAVGHNDSWTVDHQLWDAMGRLYAYCEMALTPSQRAAVLRALAGVSGLSVRDLVVDGVALVAIRQSDKKSGVEIIFDSATGHAVGSASVSLNGSVNVIPMPDGPRLDNGVRYQATWKQTIT